MTIKFFNFFNETKKRKKQLSQPKVNLVFKAKPINKSISKSKPIQHKVVLKPIVKMKQVFAGSRDNQIRFKQPFQDKDKDGFINAFDCKPFDKKKQDFSPFRYKHKKSGGREVHELTAAERFGTQNIKRLKKIGSGMDREVFALDKDKVLKIAKNPRGIKQNISESDLGGYLEQIKHHETGKDYVVMEKAQPLSLKSAHKLSELRSRTLGKYNKSYDDEKQKILNELNPDLLNYEVSMGDVLKPSSWGEKEGKMVLIDAGALNEKHISSEHRITELRKRLSRALQQKQEIVKDYEKPESKRDFGKSYTQEYLPRLNTDIQHLKYDINEWDEIVRERRKFKEKGQRDAGLDKARQDWKGQGERSDVFIDEMFDIPKEEDDFMKKVREKAAYFRTPEGKKESRKLTREANALARDAGYARGIKQFIEEEKPLPKKKLPKKEIMELLGNSNIYETKPSKFKDWKGTEYEIEEEKLSPIEETLPPIQDTKEEKKERIDEPFSDADKDKVENAFDCKPDDKTKQDFVNWNTLSRSRYLDQVKQIEKDVRRRMLRAKKKRKTSKKNQEYIGEAIIPYFTSVHENPYVKLMVENNKVVGLVQETPYQILKKQLKGSSKGIKKEVQKEQGRIYRQLLPNLINREIEKRRMKGRGNVFQSDVELERLNYLAKIIARNASSEQVLARYYPEAVGQKYITRAYVIPELRGTGVMSRHLKEYFDNSQLNSLHIHSIPEAYRAWEHHGFVKQGKKRELTPMVLTRERFVEVKKEKEKEKEQPISIVAAPLEVKKIVMQQPVQIKLFERRDL